jgi:hypothetical protein
VIVLVDGGRELRNGQHGGVLEIFWRYFGQEAKLLTDMVTIDSSRCGYGCVEVD